MQKSKIEYLSAVGGMTWNPIAMKCSPVSPGCWNCWHLRMAKRLEANTALGTRRQAAYLGGEARLIADELGAPARRRIPTTIAVQFMGDLFHDRVSPIYRKIVFGEMFELERHTFLVLTKRVDNLCRFLELDRLRGYKPANNIWFGVSVEDQATADERIPILLQTPAAHRWVSVEPMLGPVNLEQARPRGTQLDWVVCGSETGPRKRPCCLEWIDRLRDQCAAAGVPFFGKVDQNGKAIMPREMPVE